MSSSHLDGLTPTEYLIMEVLAARFRLGEYGWTFPSETTPALNRLQQRKLVNFKSGVVAYTCLAWLTDDGRAHLRLDRPYKVRGQQVGRVWEGRTVHA